MARSTPSINYAYQTEGASFNPFATPVASRPGTIMQSIASSDVGSVSHPRRRFRSSRLVGELEKPWTMKKEPRANWERWILYFFIVIGFGIGAVLCYRAVISVPKHEYCLVLDDQFSSLNPDVWNHEIQLDGFGTGSFDWTTDDPANSYTSSDGLHIVPTLTLQSTQITSQQLINGYTVNLTADGTCTSGTDEVATEDWWANPCARTSNITTGDIINPVRSARLTTSGNVAIKYGRVEVVAKMPKGDWLWPAIWLMPQDSVYGAWPRSGEIDIAEMRGNDAETYPLGNNIISAALHWGPDPEQDGFYLSRGQWGTQRDKYSNAFHTYGLEWSKDYLFMWVDGRLQQVLYVDFDSKVDLWTFGDFGSTTINGSTPDNPWSQTGQKNTPFDQPFYLILNVAVGATNGYFPDSLGGKPWLDESESPARDFWKANSTWLPTWGAGEDRGMTVQSVRMWQEGAC